MLSSLFQSVLLLGITLLILSTTRLLSILPPRRGRPKPRRRGTPTHLLVVLGSGGHTAEMLAMLRILDTRKYTHRTYVIGEGDDLSVMRARQFEAGLWETCNDTGDQKTRNEMEGSGILVNHENGDEEEKPVTSESQYGTFAIALVPRARRIHQSIFTAPISCLHTLFAAIKLLSRPSLTTSSNPTDLKHSNTSRPGIPDIILANGPATSAIVIFASLILRFFDFSGARGHAKTRIIFIESWARIKTISLSGKCVAWAVDRFVVQWEELKGMLGGRAEWHGVLVV